jgi:hypothetical protein
LVSLAVVRVAAGLLLPEDHLVLVVVAVGALTVLQFMLAAHRTKAALVGVAAAVFLPAMFLPQGLLVAVLLWVVLLGARQGLLRLHLQARDQMVQRELLSDVAVAVAVQVALHPVLVGLVVLVALLLVVAVAEHLPVEILVQVVLAVLVVFAFIHGD